MFTKSKIIESNKFNDMQIKAIKSQLSSHDVKLVSCLDFKGTSFFSSAEVVRVDFNFLDTTLRAFDIQGLFLLDSADRSLVGVIERLEEEIKSIKEKYLLAIDENDDSIELLLDFMSLQAIDLRYSIINPSFHNSVTNYVKKLHDDNLSKKDIFVEGMDYIFRNKNRIDIFVGNLGKVIHVSDL